MRRRQGSPVGGPLRNRPRFTPAFRTRAYPRSYSEALQLSGQIFDISATRAFEGTVFDSRSLLAAYMAMEDAFERTALTIQSQFEPAGAMFVTLTASTEEGREVITYLPRLQRDQLTAELLATRLATRLQSNENLTPSIRVEVVQLTPPQGPDLHLRGRYLEYRGLDPLFTKTKRCIVEIAPSGDCFLEWLILAKAQAQDVEEYKRLTKGAHAGRVRRERVEALTQSHPRWAEGVQSPELLQEIESEWNLRLVLFQRHQRGALIWPLECQLPFELEAPCLFGEVYPLDRDGRTWSHVNLVTKPHAWLGFRGFCRCCMTGYNCQPGCPLKPHPQGPCRLCHVCQGRCRACLRLDCQVEWTTVRCNCGVSLRNGRCEALHECVRARRKRCVRCGERSHGDRPCGQRHCPCGEWIERFALDHVCMIAPKELKKPSDRWAVYDFECCVDPDGVHVPYLVTCWFPTQPDLTVVQASAPTYWKTVPSVEGPVFVAHESMEPFYALLQHPFFRGWVFFAHNGRAYDHVLIKAAFLKKGLVSKDIQRGEKTLQMMYPQLQITFRDSLNFLTASLRQLPGQFGLTERAKGHFPHRLMTTAYVAEARVAEGWMPRVDETWFETDFGPDQKPMQEEALEWIRAWASEPTKWNVFDEAERYCISDTVVLGEALKRFQAEMKMSTESAKGWLDPLVHPTLPSAVMHYYLATALPERTLAVVDRAAAIQSRIADEWLGLCALRDRCVIEREVRVGPYRVDGRCGKKVYEFLGCYWHGCLSCYGPGTYHKRFQCCFREVYQATQDRLNRLQNQGWTVEWVWEHEYRRCRSTESPWVELLASHPIPLEEREPLDPRRAYRGGMTEYFSHSFPGRLQMVDVVSEYPAVSMGRTREYLTGMDAVFLEWPMPVGVPTLYRPCSLEDFAKLTTPGIAKVRVVAPKTLFAPFLGISVPSKLCSGSSETLYALCRTCAVERVEASCTHDDKDRAWIDTWTLADLRYAESLGYRIDQVFECWSYAAGSLDLFRAFLTPFAVQKMCSKRKGLVSAEGTWTESGAEVQAYCQELGVTVTPSDFVDNPARRQVAKLVQNSFTGKWGQREEHTTIREFYGSQLVEARRLLHSADVTLRGIRLLQGGEGVCLDYADTARSTEGHYEKQDHVVAYITAYGRIMIHRLIHRLGRRALYCDTDSVYYKADGDVCFQTGYRLGDMELELPEGTDFVCLGRKSYAYLDAKGLPHCRQKGVMIRCANEAQFTGPQLRQVLWAAHQLKARVPDLPTQSKSLQEAAWQDAQIETSQRYFLTLRDDDRVPRKQTVVRDKKIRFQIWSPKRWVQWPDHEDEEIKTVPFGWVE